VIELRKQDDQDGNVADKKFDNVVPKGGFDGGCVTIQANKVWNEQLSQLKSGNVFFEEANLIDFKETP
jgi:hypothetical protein